MLGWKIFVHSVRLVMSNLDVAFRISGLLYLVYATLQIWFTLRYADAIEMMQSGNEMAMANAIMNGTLMEPGFLAAQFFVAIFTLVITLWIAVAWHRHILLQDPVNGWLPTWHGSNALHYFGFSLLIGILVALVAMIATVPIGILTAATGSPGIGYLIPVVVVAIAAFGFYRLSPVLPSRALGQQLKLREAWAATANNTGAIFVLALVTAAAGIILQIPTMINGNPASIVSLIYTLVVGWFMMLIGVSTLTTLYGHFIEGRSVD